MAQYFTDFRENAIATGTPAGWTARWTAGTVTYAIQNDTSGNNASGKRLFVDQGTTGTRLLSWNIIDADPARDRVQIKALVRHLVASDASANTYGGVVGRGSGATPSESAAGICLGTDSSGYDEDIRAWQVDAGTRTFTPQIGGEAGGVWNATDYFWLTADLDGVTDTVSIASAADPNTPIASGSRSDLTVTGAGWVGVLSYGSLTELQVLAFGVGTGGDAAPIGPVSPSAAPTIGTITPSGTTASVPYTGLDLYATGVEYRIDGGAWVDAGATNPIELTGLTESTPYDIEIRAYNADGPGPVSTLATFTTTAGTLVKGATITLYSGATPQASLTDLRVLWWDATAPDGTAPDYYSASESTDASGVLSIDLDAVTTLSVGDYGYLHVHKAGTLGNAYQDALVFAGAVQVQDIG